MKVICSVIFLILFTSCSSKFWEKTPYGINIKTDNIKVDETKLISLEVIDDNIIRVVATPEDTIAKEESLSVIPQKKHVDYKVKDQDSCLILSTSELTAKVERSTGRISFYDKMGNVLLREQGKKSKTFTPVICEGARGYAIRQVFNSPEDEAFYGLGQHQSDEFNYKEKNEILYQYNTKVSIPFIVSSKDYGILWDNYSLTNFGDPREYENLNQFNLFDKDGSEGGVTATYTNTNQSIERLESSVDYENLETIKNFPEGFTFSDSKVTWEGEIEPLESGIYFFKLYYAGYIKVYVNDELVVPERWRPAWNPNTYKFDIELEKGKRYPIKLDWKPDGKDSFIGLKALSPVSKAEKERLSIASEMGNQIDYYFIHGGNIDDVISGYRKLTGKATLFPDWAYGFWQSRERYKSQRELVEVVKEYRKRNIPIDNIVLDWSYWPVDAWGSHEFNPEYFPDPAKMVDEVHSMDANIMISVWPKFYIITEHFSEFDNKGWIYRLAVEDSVKDWIGNGYIGTFYDAYNADARKLFWEQIREHIYTKGFDAWWLDATEPDILLNADIDYRKELSTPTALGPSTKYFNAYALQNAKGVYEGQRSVDPDKRVFILTRSGFAGIQRYSSAVWSGDIGARWEELKTQIPAGLNFSISGIPNWTTDIGGFSVENRYVNAKEGSEDLNEWRELYTRWHQFGAFCPIFRSHGQYPYREIFNIAPENHEAYKSMVYYNQLRYKLMPYIYSLAGMTYHNDYTIMRALIMDFGNDPSVQNIGDQYMFGPLLMVAPVYQYKATSRLVYFPNKSGWYDFYSGNYIKGGQTLQVDAPFDRIPLFVKEGSIIPFGSEIQYTRQNPTDTITLFVYTGKNGEFTLYEDEGKNYNYEKGAYSTIQFSYNEVRNELTIGERHGEFPGMLKSRIFNIVWISKMNLVNFSPNPNVKSTLEYRGEKITIKQ